MAGKTRVLEGTQTRYEVRAFYQLFKNRYMLAAFRDTLEDCYQWLKEHKTKPVLVNEITTRSASMINYFIIKETTERSICEQKEIESGKRV